MGDLRLPLRARRLAALAALLPFTLHSTGVTGADVLKARLGGRPAALGEAYVALGDDLASMYYNPAGLAALKTASLSFLHYAAVAGISTEQLAYAHPTDAGAIAVSFLYRGQPDISNPLATDQPVVAYDLVLGLSYAQSPAYFLQDLPELLQKSHLGLNLKWVRSHLGRFDADAYAIDAGLRMPLPLAEDLVGAVSLLNLGTQMKFIDVADPLPALLQAGVAKKFDLWEGNALNVAADLEAPFYGTMRIHVGLEDKLGKSLALRFGYLIDSPQSLNGLTGGLGLELDQEGLAFGVDYAYRPLYYDGFNSFEAQHLLQMRLGF